MKLRFATLLFLAATGSAACAGVPRPSLLVDLDKVREGAAAAEAKRYAADAFAKAEKLRGEAEAAFSSHDTAGAQLLSEHALAAYARAHALARIGRAQAGAAEADAALATAESELAALDADQTRVGAETDALELKVRVARDAQPIQPSGKADPEREKARHAAARSLALVAKLLCGAARLLAGAPPPAQLDAKAGAQLGEAEAALAKLESQLGATAATPIDEATRVRAGCLAALTALRRAATPVTKAPGTGDALLAAISAAGSFAPSRDDRGVAVTLRNLFGGSALSPAGEAKLVELGKIAAAHPSFPIEVVVHTDKPVGAKDEGAQRSRGEAVIAALQKGGKGSIRAIPIAAGNQAPLVDPKGPDKARNARLEIVFVTPEMF